MSEETFGFEGQTWVVDRVAVPQEGDVWLRGDSSGIPVRWVSGLQNPSTPRRILRRLADTPERVVESGVECGECKGSCMGPEMPQLGEWEG